MIVDLMAHWAGLVVTSFSVNVTLIVLLFYIPKGLRLFLFEFTLCTSFVLGPLKVGFACSFARTLKSFISCFMGIWPPCNH